MLFLLTSLNRVANLTRFRQSSKEYCSYVLKTNSHHNINFYKIIDNKGLLISKQARLIAILRP